MSFLYFAYGSNMLKQRMHINCPSALFKCIGELKNFKLSSTDFAHSWKGAVATILECKNDSVWGVVWEISKEHEEKLDLQEKDYQPLILPIETELFGKLNCKVYQRLVHKEEMDLVSCIYKAVCIQGAKEHGLPLEYIKKLEAIQDNNYKGPIDIPVKINI
ncbi:gamma-glutamylcyclotransferase-like [Argiope bruennichi]|uniref:gamma-glutamylcyclotransferase-like n=1 Tax=Argiope bruennichi TaxID=94029 RepID=UPI002494A903|nr:gamma-glutamylcyclotransferase-like [Argiope bruennichi]XP_055934198.1 gamma-glutamylcyclotransferase-like [Argiope bruennichi]XP_055934199.1 gamma-glutamylcyclotransferase-like [Argiope bruennichi]